MKQHLRFSVGKRWVLSLAVLCSSLPAISQYGEKTSSWEIGATIGPSNFLGDLGGNAGKGTRFIKDNNFPMTNLTYGVYVTYQPTEWLGFRLAGNLGKLEGDDKIIKGKGGYEEARKSRNQDFRSKFTEGLLLAEFYPTVFIEYDPSDVWRKLRPYVVGGVGIFKFNPQGKDPLTGRYVDLTPLSLEGQGFAEYPDRKVPKLTQMNFPLGVGVKYFLNEKVSLSLEVIHRTTFTDEIDAVSTTYIDPALFYKYFPVAKAQLAERMANKNVDGSPYHAPGRQRGNSGQNDAYYTFGIKFGIRLGGGGDGYNNSTRCPIRF
jgi:hypothetical protein